MPERADAILAARRALPAPPGAGSERKAEMDGDCGVIGIAADVPVAGRHLLQALVQMRNRGNGKGGGIAAAGMDPKQLGVDARGLNDD